MAFFSRCILDISWSVRRFVRLCNLFNGCVWFCLVSWRATGEPVCLEFQTHLYAAAISQEKLQFILQQTGHAHTHTHTHTRTHTHAHTQTHTNTHTHTHTHTHMHRHTDTRTHTHTHTNTYTHTHARTRTHTHAHTRTHTHTHTHTHSSAGMPGPDKEVIKAAGFLISIITTYLPDIFFLFPYIPLTLNSMCSFIIVVCLSMSRKYLVLSFPRQTKKELKTVSLLSFQVSQTSQSKPNQLHCMLCKYK